MYTVCNGLVCSISLKRLCPAVCGLLVLLKTDLDSEGLQDRPPERVLYLRLEQTPAWAQQDLIQKPDAFTRCAYIFWRGNYKKDRVFVYSPYYPCFFLSQILFFLRYTVTCVMWSL